MNQIWRPYVPWSSGLITTTVFDIFLYAIVIAIGCVWDLFFYYYVCRAVHINLVDVDDWAISITLRRLIVRVFHRKKSRRRGISWFLRNVASVPTSTTRRQMWKSLEWVHAASTGLKNNIRRTCLQLVRWQDLPFITTLVNAKNITNLITAINIMFNGRP